MTRVDYVVSYTTTEGKPRTRAFAYEQDALEFAKAVSAKRVERTTIDVIWPTAI